MAFPFIAVCLGRAAGEPSSDFGNAKTGCLSNALKARAAALPMRLHQSAELQIKPVLDRGSQEQLLSLRSCGKLHCAIPAPKKFRNADATRQRTEKNRNGF